MRGQATLSSLNSSTRYVSYIRPLAICFHGILICAYTCLLDELVLASLHLPPQEQVSSVGDKKEKKRKRRQRRTREGEMRGPMAQKGRKSPGPSTDVVLARSTRNDVRWSCLVYPNYIPFIPASAARTRFMVIFYLFFYG